MEVFFKLIRWCVYCVLVWVLCLGWNRLSQRPNGLTILEIRLQADKWYKKTEKYIQELLDGPLMGLCIMATWFAVICLMLLGMKYLGGLKNV